MLARLSVLKSPALLKITGTEDDNTLKLLISAATAEAQSPVHCARTLLSTVYVDELYRGDCSRELWPVNVPVTAVTVLKIWDGSAFTALDPTHYSIVDGTYVLYPTREAAGSATYSGFPKDCEDNIKLSYTAGYDSTGWDTKSVTDSFGVPADLEYAVCVMAALRHLDSFGGQARLGISSQTRGAEGFTTDRYERGLPPDVLEILAAYRRRGLP
jgi:hypothetical protein